MRLPESVLMAQRTTLQMQGPLGCLAQQLGDTRGREPSLPSPWTPVWAASLGGETQEPQSPVQRPAAVCALPAVCSCAKGLVVWSGGGCNVAYL